MLIPVVFAFDGAVADNQCRCVTDVRLPPELHHVIVDRQIRQTMFYTGVAVGHHVHVHVIQRAAFGDHHHFFAPRGLGNLLALVAPGLVVIFDTDCALTF